MSGVCSPSASLWAFGAFRRLWTAALLGSIGTWAVQVGLTVGVLAKHSGGQLAAVLLAGNVPALLVGPLGGAVVDRFRPDVVARISMVVQVLGLLAIATTLDRWLVAAACGYAVFLIAGRFSAPALQRLRYQVLPDSLWAAANGVVGSVNGISTIVGAAVGTATVTTLGTFPTFALAAGLAALAAVAIGPVRATTHAGAARRLEFGGGLAALRRYPVARAVVFVGVAWGLIGGGYDVLLGVFGAQVLDAGGLGIGLLYLADGVGVLVGSFFGGRLPVRRRVAAFTAGYVAQGALWALFALSPGLVVALFVLLAMRIASGVIIALDTTLLLDTVPEQLHGRVFSMHMVSYGAMLRVSLTLIGALLGVTGPQILVLGGGVGSVLVGLCWAIAMYRGQFTRR